MKTYTRFLSVLLLGLAIALVSAPALRAQTTPPVLIVNIVEIDVSDGTLAGFEVTAGGQGYASAPNVTLTGGGYTVAATAGAQVAGGAVTEVDLGYAGQGYIGAPTVSFTGGGTPTTPASGAAAEAFLNFPFQFKAPFQNEVYGPAGNTIQVVAQATGTQPGGGFVYSFLVNGLPIGQTSPAAPPGTPAGGPWTPPLPGVYDITTSTTDGSNSATSQAIRYFAVGTAIVLPEAGSYPPLNTGQNGVAPGILLPAGSALVVQATSTPADGFVQRIDFYTDWDTNPTLIGSATSYPYSIIYTPSGTAGSTHLLKAIGYDNNGNAIPVSYLTAMDEVNITLATPNPNPLPTSQIISPANGAIVQMPVSSGGSSGIQILATAGSTTTRISKVELYINGVLFATDTAYPYTFSWSPTVTGAYSLTALAYDDYGNVIASTSNVTVDAAPAVAITSPGIGAQLNSGAPTSFSAIAVDTNTDSNGNPATITSVQFFQDGTFVGSTATPTSGDTYTVSFKPVQNVVNGQVAPSSLTVTATDSLGFTGISAAIDVNVTSGGTGAGTVIGTPPTVTLTAPSSGTSVVVNTPVTLSATASAPNGNVASITFYVDNTQVGTVSKYPYNLPWTFANLGNYEVSAVVVDNVGDQVTSSVTSVSVVAQPPPTISISNPAAGSTVSLGSSITVSANAAATAPGTVAQVQFFANGVSIGTVTTAPYSVAWTPTSAGVYNITAQVTDNSGGLTTSSTYAVEVEPSSASAGTGIYFGNYQGSSSTDAGLFAVALIDGTYAAYIGHSALGDKAATSYLPGLSYVSTNGSFSTPTSAGAPAITGTASATGVSGTLLPGQESFIGTVTTAGATTVAAGYYTGSLLSQPNSQVAAIVGYDGSIIIYVSNGTFSDSAGGLGSGVDAAGNFSLTTVGNNTLTGTVNPTTGFLTGTLSGGSGGTLLAARVSGGTFSDGVLQNLSTRGQVGNGVSQMIAGFVVGGTQPKQLLVRAVGPTLGNYGLTGLLAAPQLSVYSASNPNLAPISNTGWSSTPTNATLVQAANTLAGAFPLALGSADSAIVSTFNPGAYTAVVSGVGGTTGLALVEIYDLDPYAPFSAKKLVNVSTRGSVGTGSNILIGGFIVNGGSPKRLLIRGVGPTLGSVYSVTGALAKPLLQLFDSSGHIIRENATWQAGNDGTLVTAAATQAGAFPLASGSADSAILIVVPPGAYTAEVSGAAGSTGIGLVEVYEVP